MRINVGSKNQTKIAGVQNAIALYPKLFPDAEVIGVDIPIELYGHPKNLTETVAGAVDRAKQAFTDCDYSIGLEGGLMAVPHSTTGYMETGVCAIYDGSKIYLGLSPSFEWPTEATKLILSNEADGSQALKQIGLTEHEKIGTGQGAVGLLTDGKLTREKFVEYSVIMAIIQVEHPHYY